MREGHGPERGECLSGRDRQQCRWRPSLSSPQGGIRTDACGLAGSQALHLEQTGKWPVVSPAKWCQPVPPPLSLGSYETPERRYKRLSLADRWCQGNLVCLLTLIPWKRGGQQWQSRNQQSDLSLGPHGKQNLLGTCSGLSSKIPRTATHDLIKQARSGEGHTWVWNTYGSQRGNGGAR